MIYEIINGLSRLKLNGTQFKIVLAILYHNKDNYCREFSLAQLSNAINTNIKQTSRELMTLRKLNIILTVVKHDHINANVYQVNKDMSQWLQNE